LAPQVRPLDGPDRRVRTPPPSDGMWVRMWRALSGLTKPVLED
jgi:hypothetical protein